MASYTWSDLIGTVKSYFRIGSQGPRLKDDSGHLQVRNAGDTADANVKANLLKLAGDSLQINYDAAGSGNDFSYTLQRPTSSMSNAVTLTLPAGAGSNGQLLKTDGSGVLSWTNAAEGSDTTFLVRQHVTRITHASSTPVALCTLPGDYCIDHVAIIIDIQFDGTPTMTIGTSGNTSKYVASTDVDLTQPTKTNFILSSGELQVIGDDEELILTYSAGSATAGSARVIINYSRPDGYNTING